MRIDMFYKFTASKLALTDKKMVCWKFNLFSAKKVFGGSSADHFHIQIIALIFGYSDLMESDKNRRPLIFLRP